MLDLTQEELAQRAGCSVFALRKIESGERRPSKQLAELLARALEIPPEDQHTFIRVARGQLNLERLNLERLPAPARTDAAGPAARPAFAPAPHHLPGQAAPLVGRQPELAALKRLFDDPQCRLLTLMGLGGIGKTRLAAGFAASQLEAFPGGAHYVPLASLSSPELIVPAIAEVFGLAFSGPTDPKEQLLDYLAHHTRQAWLLILDNLEHLLSPHAEGDSRSGAAGLVMEILERLPNVKILATSRERLNLQGEWMFELHGLPVPPTDYTGKLDDFGAVTVFMMNARRAKAGFEMTPDERPALIRICQLLEGVPLAIELAAAWVGMLSCQEIAREIEASLDFLTTSMRDIPERHRSIRATFNHSWKLLPDEDGCTLRRLAVFHGGFTRQAAEAIAGASLHSLASLHARSLVRRSDDGRFDLHEVIRQYALSYFAGDPRYVETCDHHSEYYLGLVRDREKDLKSAAQQDAIHELSAEMDNVRAAWAWAIEHEKFGWIGGALRSYSWLCNVAGWMSEGIKQLEMVVQVLILKQENEDLKTILGLALAQQGMLNFRKGRLGHAQALYAESLSVLRPVGDPAALADPLVYSGVLSHLCGDIEGAKAQLAEGLICARAAGDRWFEAYALYNQGYIDSLTGEYAGGYDRMQAGLAIWRELGDPSSIGMGLNYISPAAIQLGYLTQAQAFLQESLSLCMQVGERWGIGTAYRNLGLVKLALGNPQEAKLLLELSLEVFGQSIVGWDIARSLTYLGDALAALGDLQQARMAYLDALRSAREPQTLPVALDALVGLARLKLLAGEPEQALEITANVFSQAACVQATREEAGRLALEAENELDERQVRAIRAGGVEQPLESLFQRLLEER